MNATWREKVLESGMVGNKTLPVAILKAVGAAFRMPADTRHGTTVFHIFRSSGARGADRL